MIILKELNQAKHDIFEEANCCMGGMFETPSQSDIDNHFNDMDMQVLEYACAHERATFEYVGTEHDGDREYIIFGNVEVAEPNHSIRIVYELGQREESRPKVMLVLWRGRSYAPVLLSYRFVISGCIREAINSLYERAWAVAESLSTVGF